MASGNSLKSHTTYQLIETEWCICVSKLTIIVSDIGSLPVWCQSIIWTNAEMLFIGLLGTNFSEVLIEFHTFPLKKMPLNMLFGKWWPFCLILNVLK